MRVAASRHSKPAWLVLRGLACPLLCSAEPRGCLEGCDSAKTGPGLWAGLGKLQGSRPVCRTRLAQRDRCWGHPLAPHSSLL